MSKQEIIEKTIRLINELPDDKAAEIVDLILKKYEESVQSADIQKLIIEGKSFDYLKEEEDLYTLSDLKVKYNA